MCAGSKPASRKLKMRSAHRSPQSGRPRTLNCKGAPTTRSRDSVRP